MVATPCSKMDFFLHSPGFHHVHAYTMDALASHYNDQLGCMEIFLVLHSRSSLGIYVGQMG